jgi:hypothetical protein
MDENALIGELNKLSDSFRQHQKNGDFVVCREYIQRARGIIKEFKERFGYKPVLYQYMSATLCMHLTVKLLEVVQ